MSGPFLHRSWLNVPAVTQHDEADITEIEAYRKELDDAAKADKKKPFRVSLLPFLMKACVSAMKAFPGLQFVAEPGQGRADLQEILQYRHRRRHAGRAGRAGHQGCRPQGRIWKSRANLARSRPRRATASCRRPKCRARLFTISSLGGIGGTGFTPIVNAPEVAILGVVRSKMAPVWNGEEFMPRLMLPLSLSYDHRVIDGAAAARLLSPSRAFARRRAQARPLNHRGRSWLRKSRSPISATSKACRSSKCWSRPATRSRRKTR